MATGSMRDIAQFGAPLGEYRGGLARIFYGVGGLAILGLGALMALSTVFADGDAGSKAVILIFGLLVAAVGGYMLWLVIAALGTRVQLLEGGFSATQRGKTTVAAWSDVASITQQITRIRSYGIPVWTSHNYRLTLTNGQKLRFTETLGKVGQMGEVMQRQITRALTPRAMESLRSGASLPFGKLSVNPMGISNGSETRQRASATASAAWSRWVPWSFRLTSLIWPPLLLRWCERASRPSSKVTRRWRVVC